jgi:hypothetical protein
MCRKTGAVREARLPAPKSWLAKHAGFVVFDAATGKIAASGTRTGRHEIKLNGRTLSIEVAPDEVVWVSAASAFRESSMLFNGQPATNDPE